MKCEFCDGDMKTIVYNMPFYSKAVGKIYIPNIKQHKCDKCGDTLIPLGETDKIAKYVSEKELEALNSLPIGDFITLNQAAESIGISKQAFNKNSRIKKGFIYSIEKDGRRFYYKKSVEAFKKNGRDGRIPLTTEIAVDINKMMPTFSYDEPLPSYTLNNYIKPELFSIKSLENIYAQCADFNKNACDHNEVVFRAPELCNVFEQKGMTYARKVR